MQLCCWWSMPPSAGILFGESGLAAHLKPGTVVMVSSTIASADAQAIAEALAEYQLLMLDAPVSGGAVKAAAGDMTVMASGSDAAFARLAPVLDAGRQSPPHRERHWSWLDGKIIHQLLAGVHIAVAAEAMALAARAGIPLETMYDVVTHAAGNSPMFENRIAARPGWRLLAKIRCRYFLSKIRAGE